MAITKETIWGSNWKRNWRQSSGVVRGIAWSIILCWMLAGSLATGTDLVIEPFQSPAGWVCDYFGQDASLPVCSANIGGESCLNFPYEFTANTVRGTWYKNLGSINLSAYTHLKFRANGLAASKGLEYITIYLKTGSGGYWWYNVNLSDQQWQTFVLPLADFSADGTCTGWSDIRSILISPWQKKQFGLTDNSIYTFGTGTGSFALLDMRATFSTSVNLLHNGVFGIWRRWG